MENILYILLFYTEMSYQQNILIAGLEALCKSKIGFLTTISGI